MKLVGDRIRMEQKFFLECLDNSNKILGTELLLKSDHISFTKDCYKVW